MRIFTPQQMNTADKTASEKFGIPVAHLMANAAAGLLAGIERVFGPVRGKSAVIFAGKGNNGGDALAAARLISAAGGNVKVFLAAPPDEMNSEAAREYRMNEAAGISQTLPGTPALLLLAADETDNADLAVDGIYGTGFRSPASGLAAELIDIINSHGNYIVSADIPSGLDGLTGTADPHCVRADLTVTFQLPKLGTVIKDGPEYCGRLEIADIGIPDDVLTSVPGREIRMTGRAGVRAALPQRRNDTHKGDYGKILIATGSVGMTGAGCLAARAALRAGAGLVYAAVPAGLEPIYAAVVPEAVLLPVEGYSYAGGGPASGRLTPTPALTRLLATLRGCTACAIGPGLDTGAWGTQLLETLLKESKVPTVLDAGALQIIAGSPDILKLAQAPVIITPHPGEMAALCGRSVQEIQNDRIGIAADFAEKMNVTVVLKGWRSVIALPGGPVFINPTGNPGMATAGSGDVLTGMIAAFCGEGMEPGEAAVAGAYLHGEAGDRAASAKSMRAMIASDIIEALPEVFNESDLG